MNITITTKPQFHFSISQAAVSVLSKLADAHYDSTCRRLTARAGEHAQYNGLLRIWQDQLDHLETVVIADNPAVDVRADFRDLDLLLKCMESCSWLPPAEQLVVHGLRRDFQGALGVANGKHEAWTAEYASPDAATA